MGLDQQTFTSWNCFPGYNAWVIKHYSVDEINLIKLELIFLDAKNGNGSKLFSCFNCGNILYNIAVLIIFPKYNSILVINSELANVTIMLNMWKIMALPNIYYCQIFNVITNIICTKYKLNKILWSFWPPIIWSLLYKRLPNCGSRLYLYGSYHNKFGNLCITQKIWDFQLNATSQFT